MIRFDPQAMPSGSASGSEQPAAYTPGSTHPSQELQSQEEMPKLDTERLKQQAIQTRDEVAEAVKSRAASYFDEQRTYVAEVIDDLAKATHHCVDELRQENHPQISRLTEALADGMDNVSKSLRSQDVNYFLNRAQTFAKERPGVILGGALALGFLTVRFLKSSNRTQQSMIENRSQSYSGSESQRESLSGQGFHNEIPAGSGTQYTI